MNEFYDLFNNGNIPVSSNFDFGLEARNVIKDKFLRLNDSPIYVGNKSVTETTVIYSLMNTAEESLDLFKTLKLKKSNLLVYNLRLYYLPRILKEKLPNKTIIKNYNQEYTNLMKNKKIYDIQAVVNNEDRIKNASTIYDMSYLTSAIKENTIDKGLKMNRKMREHILEMYKSQFVKDFGLDNKLIYCKAPFLSNTSIKLNIVESNMLTIFNPFLLFMEWFVNNPDEFKRWMKTNKITFVLEGTNRKLLILSGREAFTDIQMFKPVYILRLLHTLDGKKETEIQDMVPETADVSDKELSEDVSEPILTDDSVIDNDITETINTKDLDVEPEIGSVDSKEESDKKADKAFDKLDKADVNQETEVEVKRSKWDSLILGSKSKEISKPPIYAAVGSISQSKIEVIESGKLDKLEDDITEIEINAAETSPKGREKDYFKIIEDDSIPPEDKGVEILETHNYTDLKKTIETPEITKLRKNIIKKYGRPVDEIVADVKEHQLPVEHFKNVTDTDTSYDHSTLYEFNEGYKEKISKQEFENILASPMKLTYPIMLQGYTEKDISDREQHVKEVTATYETFDGTPLEFKFNVPLTDEHGRLFLGGSWKHLTLQNAAKPVSKSDETVIITTDYSKTIIHMTGKYANMRLKMIALTLKAFDKDAKVMKVKTTDALGDFIYTNQVSYNLIHLNRQFNGCINADMNFDFRGLGVDKETGLTLLGHFHNKNVYHDPAKDICVYEGKEYESIDFIVSCIRSVNPEEFDKCVVKSATTSGINTPVAKIMNKNIPVILLLCIAMPIKDLLDKLVEENGLEYKTIRNGTQQIDKLKNNDKFGIIRLRDYTIVLKYNNTLNEILLTYLTTIDLTKYDAFDITNIMEDFAGNANTALYIENFIEFFIGPETERICKMYNIPSDFVGIFIYACSLFTSHITFKKNDARNYRLMGQDEVINRVIYDVISKELSANAARMKRGSRPRININKDAVIMRLQELPNMSEANQLSPFRETLNHHMVSLKGHNGINEPRAFTLDVRAFNDNNIGTETTSTPYSGTAGVVKYLPMNPVIEDLTGQYETHDTTDGMGASQYSSFVESYVPYLSHDHINRTIMVSGQFNHIKPVEGADPMLVSCHADENSIYNTPSFSYIAKGKGKITSITDQFCKIKYEDGTVDVISLENINRNSDKGYYLKNDFMLDDKFKVGSTVHKGEVVAYSKNFYKKKPNGQIGLCAGALVWVLFCDSQYVWEDSCLVFQDLSEKLSSRVVKRIARVIDLNTEIRDWNVNIGSDVNPNDILFKYKVLTDDETINELFANAEALSLKEVDAHYKGKIVDVRAYWRKAQNVEMSPSVRKFIKAVDDIQRVQCHMNDLDDVSDQFTKALYDRRPTLLTKDKFSKINGDRIDNGQMLVEYSIEIIDKLGPGDKIVTDRALKGEPTMVMSSNLRPEGVKSGRRPSLLSATLGYAKRMTAGMSLHGMLISILLHEANYARLLLNEPAEPGSLLDYYSSAELIKEYKK